PSAGRVATVPDFFSEEPPSGALSPGGGDGRGDRALAARQLVDERDDVVERALRRVEVRRDGERARGRLGGEHDRRLALVRQALERRAQLHHVAVGAAAVEL